MPAQVSGLKRQLSKLTAWRNGGTKGFRRRAAAAMTASGDWKPFDAHLHVWAPEEEGTKATSPYRHAKSPPEGVEGHWQKLVELQKEAGVEGALIVQPAVQGSSPEQHAYVRDAIRANPRRFTGCMLADPSRERCVAEMDELLRMDEFRAVRFNPYLFEKERMAGDVGKELFAKAGEHGAPVGFMCFHGLMRHIDDIEELCKIHPETPVMMDHFGFCESNEGEDWNRLLRLADYPQVYVKLSAFFRVSQESFPYSDVKERVTQLLDKFGPPRLLWGTDWPFADSMGCGYGQCSRILPQLGLSSKEMEEVMGGAARRLLRFPPSQG